MKLKKKLFLNSNYTINIKNYALYTHKTYFFLKCMEYETYFNEIKTTSL